MKNKSIFFLFITAIIILSMVVRFIPSFPNFAPMGALALFAVAFYKRSSLAIGITAVAWWLSDLFLNNYVYELNESFTFFTQFQLYTLLSLIAIISLGKLLFTKITLVKAFAGSLGASLIFFIISNFGVWMQGTMYPMNLSGLITCYEMALPFYRATLSSDLIFTIVFFGLMFIIQEKTATDYQITIA